MRVEKSWVFRVDSREFILPYAREAIRYTLPLSSLGSLSKVKQYDYCRIGRQVLTDVQVFRKQIQQNTNDASLDPQNLSHQHNWWPDVS